MAAPMVKQEPAEEIDIESKIIELCSQNPKGISDEVIKQSVPQCDIQQRVTAVNRLLSTNRLELLKSGSKLLYRLKDPEAAKEVKGADTEEKVVFQIIKDAQNKGIWTREIRMKSNLKNIQVLNKILKNLESKKLIKAVKSVNASKRKVYMLYNLEPDQSVTGGPWYSASEFESEFVEILNAQAHKFLQQRAIDAQKVYVDEPWTRLQASYATAEDVLKYITNLGISKVNLSLKDMEAILDTLIYDGKIELSARTAGSVGSTSGDSSIKIYRAVKTLSDTSAFVRTPCGVCPVISRCTVDGLISPKTCIYMKDWLDF
ncbi:DNA-directed RNA polymerase III subunit RPC6 isoform X2 [Aplysia californica]|uniref:DNA-directed RNA polymerase III subunit RPC6 n=1 Tax=Aplysia californica TaxID=6500 RepID=A0ABM1A7D8_APLCA|nr:DNA-directed RNA polymerase III subunit RPC6 isoform X2 [Aplysia californica]